MLYAEKETNFAEIFKNLAIY